MLGNVSLSNAGNSMVMRYKTSDGKKGVLQWDRDMLASAGGSGGTVHARYHESSTAEDPVAVIWGTSQSGKTYKNIVHLNDIDPHTATPAEMTALNAHLSRTAEKNTESPIALWASKNAGVDAKMDYEQYYENYIAMQRQSGNSANADLYRAQMERFLFFCQQNQKQYTGNR